MAVSFPSLLAPAISVPVARCSLVLSMISRLATQSGCSVAKRRRDARWCGLLILSSMQKIQVGVQLQSRQECPWTAELPKATDAPSIPPENCRRWERHKISVVLALHDERATTPMRLTATDISASGCYVETIFPLTIGTSLKVDLWIASEKLTTRSFVRTSDPGLGMGIEFIGLKPEDQQRFQEYLKALNPWGCSIERQNSRAKDCGKD